MFSFHRVISRIIFKLSDFDVLKHAYLIPHRYSLEKVKFIGIHMSIYICFPKYIHNRMLIALIAFPMRKFCLNMASDNWVAMQQSIDLSEISLQAPYLCCFHVCDAYIIITTQNSISGLG